MSSNIQYYIYFRMIVCMFIYITYKGYDWLHGFLSSIWSPWFLDLLNFAPKKNFDFWGTTSTHKNMTKQIINFPKTLLPR